MPARMSPLSEWRWSAIETRSSELGTLKDDLYKSTDLENYDLNKVIGFKVICIMALGGAQVKPHLLQVELHRIGWVLRGEGRMKERAKKFEKKLLKAGEVVAQIKQFNKIFESWNSGLDLRHRWQYGLVGGTL